jgi:putative membrane protein
MAEDSPSPTGDEVVDATRRTLLASERTYLAWWRTALTAFAVSLGAGRIVPELAGGSRWPYEIVGVGYAVLGVIVLGYGLRRQRAVERALAVGRFPPADAGFMAVLAGLGIALGVLTLVLVLAA